MNWKFTGKDFFYWMFIAISIIVGLLTTELGNNDNLVSYIGFAGTLISIILAVIAIIYSFYQSGGMSGMNDKIQASVDSANNVVNKVDTATEVYRDLSEKSIIKIDSLTTDIMSYFNQKLDETNRGLSGLSTQIAEMTEKAQPEKVEEHTPLTEFKYTEKQIVEFLDNSSILGKSLMFFLSLAYKEKIKFDPREMCNAIYEKMPDYVWGYYIATKSLGLFDTVKEGDNIRVSTISEQLRLKASEKVEERELDGKYMYRDKIVEYVRSKGSDIQF